MTSITRQAIKDADEYARAKMFYGEGAGVRRRLINQTVQFKLANIPGYDVAFQKELAKQDFAKLSRSARKERRRIDAGVAIAKNSKALVRGDYRALSLPLLVVAGSCYVAHQTGYDKKALNYTRKQYTKAQVWIDVKHDQWKARHDHPKAASDGASTETHKVTALGATGPITQPVR